MVTPLQAKSAACAAVPLKPPVQTADFRQAEYWGFSSAAICRGLSFAGGRRYDHGGHSAFAGGTICLSILSVKPSGLSVIAAITGFIGVGLLVLGPGAQLDTIGITAALAGAGAMGLGTVLVKRWQPPVPLMVFTAWQLAIGGLLLLPVALITEGPFTDLSRTNLWGFIYLGVIGTGLAYALWFRGISKLSPTAVSYLGLLSPVVATLVGYVFLQETFTAVQLAGVAVVLTSVVIGQQS